MPRKKSWAHENPIKRLVVLARLRARRKGIPCTITHEHVRVPDRCPALGIPLEFGSGNRDNSPSIDRLDSSRGYTPDNIIVVSSRANRLKNNATVEELRLVAQFYEDLMH